MEEQNLTNEPNEQIQLSTEFSESLKKWLKIFGEHYLQAITEVNALAYTLGLRDLRVEELDQGCEKALMECDFIPKISDIRKRSGSRQRIVEEISEQIYASEVFEKAKSWARANSSEIPRTVSEELPPSVDYAMRIAGGASAFLDAGQEYWVRKRFIESYLEIRALFFENGIASREAAKEFLAGRK